MSGAAALAAARRRRAGANAPMTPATLKRPETLDNNVNNEIVNTPVVNQKINPTMMLLNHNKVIENLQMVVSNINETIDNDIMNKNDVKQLVHSVVENAITNLKVSENNIEFFKNKYNRMESQLNELKKHIIKVQTFAMETNLQCIELKKKLFRENNNKLKTMDQIMKSDEHKLPISAETTQEQVEQLKQNTHMNQILQDATNNNEEIIGEM